MFNQVRAPLGTYPITMRLRPGNVDAEIGDVSYPTVPCTSKLILEGVSAQTVTLHENVVTGICLNGTFTLQFRGAEVNAEWRGSPSDQVGGSATLTKAQ
jgi:hypothetical protein